ncbi:MAG: hypothetical protein ACLPRE_07750 [Limisphaerales bacterium]
MLRIIFKQFPAGQSFQNIIQRKIFSDHFLVSMNGKSNLLCADLLSYSRLDFVVV